MTQSKQDLDAVLHWRGKHKEVGKQRDALRQQLADITNERDLLKRALGGMLFAFDDGVGQDWSAPLLDYARQHCPAVEFKSEWKLVQKAEVIRDENGMFQHPEMPDFDEGDEETCKAWIAEQGLQVKMVSLEYHSDEAISARYFEAGDPDCSYWEPDVPDGKGWFCLAIHDTDDGPVCWWARRAIAQSTPTRD